MYNIIYVIRESTIEKISVIFKLKLRRFTQNLKRYTWIPFQKSTQQMYPIPSF